MRKREDEGGREGEGRGKVEVFRRKGDEEGGEEGEVEV